VTPSVVAFGTDEVIVACPTTDRAWIANAQHAHRGPRDIDIARRTRIVIASATAVQTANALRALRIRGRPWRTLTAHLSTSLHVTRETICNSTPHAR